jgi:hypothetical protein
MIEAVVIPVPETVLATYVVPLPEEPADLRALARDGIVADLPAPLRTLVLGLLDSTMVQVDAIPADQAEPLPLALMQAFGADESAVVTVARGQVLAVVQVVFHPGWPPAHEWAARALATGIARHAGAPVVDIFTPRLLTAAAAFATLPDQHGFTRLADWLLVSQSPADHGYWSTTKGLHRFGLPELQAFEVPPELAPAWTRALSGLALALSQWWSDTLDVEDKPAFVELPDPFVFDAGHVALAYGLDPPEDPGTAAVHFELDPSTDPAGDTFLTVMPPREAPVDGSFVVHVCEQLFGRSTPGPP